MKALEVKERPWYADWRVWLCLLLFAIGGLAQAIAGLPFRLLGWLWGLLVG